MEEKKKHSPGPWKPGYGKADGGYLGVWEDNTTHVICRVSPINTMDDFDIPNAILIAMGPRLLEACKEALSALNEIPNHELHGKFKDSYAVCSFLEKALKDSEVENGAIQEENEKPVSPTPILTAEDWVEIYYALDARRFMPPVCDDLTWDNHLRGIMDRIGPDGTNMQVKDNG